MSLGTRAGGAARHAVLRWAWRLFRRDWRQQVLVLALMTIGVAGAVAASTLALTLSPSSNAQFGDAEAMATLDATNPAVARAAVVAAHDRFGPVQVIGHRSVSVPGSAAPLDLRAETPGGPFGGPLLALREGRFPAKPGEAALTVGVANLLDAGIGHDVSLGGVRRTVVGVVEDPSDLSDDFALVTPGSIASPDSLTLLFDTSRSGPGAGSANSAAAPRFAVIGRGDNGSAGMIALVATTLGMSLVGLLAAAGFVVVAQRRQRQLGLLAAIGATPRQLRLVMLANGAIIGALAAVGGALLGLAGWVMAAPAVEIAANHRIDRFDFPWGRVVECGLLALVVATAAAWWPARSLSRMPVMAALSGRPERPLAVHRSLVLAGALTVLGLAAIAFSHPTGDSARPLLLVGGIAAVVVGVVLAAPAAVRGLAKTAGRLPFASRLALRDLARYQARAAAALAAITLGLGICLTLVGVASANEYRANDGNLSDRQLLIQVGDPRTAPDPGLTASERRSLDANAATVDAAIGGSSMLTLDVAMNPVTAHDTSLREPIAETKEVSSGTTRVIEYPYVATPQLLHRYGIGATTIHSDTDLLTERTDDVSLQDFTTRRGENAAIQVQRVDLPSYGSAPNSLITESALRRHGWVTARTGWLVESKQPLTSDQIARARSAAARVGLVIETRSHQDGLTRLRDGATAAGALLAWAIVAMTISLIRGEAAQDLRTLTATGAGARTRRALTASTAGALALLGVVLGTVGAGASLAVAYHSQINRLANAPSVELVLLVVGTPVVAAAGGWLLSGREPRTYSRMARE